MQALYIIKLKHNLAEQHVRRRYLSATILAPSNCTYMYYIYNVHSTESLNMCGIKAYMRHQANEITRTCLCHSFMCNKSYSFN